MAINPASTSRNALGEAAGRVSRVGRGGRRRPAPPPARPERADDTGPLRQAPVLDVYARLSKAVNGETINVEDQVELCVEKIHERGGQVGEIFKDNSLSAWNPKVVRPDWNRLMERLESGASEGVMVYDLFRFSRKVIEGERLLELASRRVKVWALAGEYDLTTADGRRHFREAMVAAASESDKISERVKRGKLRRARRGRYYGGGRAYALSGWAPAPPGWEPGDPREQVAPERVAAEAAIVRDCYRRLLAGESVSALVHELNARGEAGERAALPVSGAPWRRGVFVRSMTRPALAGLLAHNGAVIGELATMEPVVSREDWERLCALMASRKTGRPPERRHVLSGLVSCAVCGFPLTGYPRNALPPYSDGTPKREYRCRPRADYPGTANACGRNHIDGRMADAAVRVAVRARLGDPRQAERIAEHLANTSQRRAELEAELARWEQAADDLATKTATWGVARVDTAMAPILREMQNLRADLAALEEPDRIHASTSTAVAGWDTAVDDGDIRAQRAIIKRVFPQLAVIMPRGWGDHEPDRFLWNGPAVERHLPSRAALLPARKRGRPSNAGYHDVADDQQDDQQDGKAATP